MTWAAPPLVAVGDIATAANWNILANNETFLLPGTTLVTQKYAPASRSLYTVNTSALTALDATNATIAFTVPATGNVDICVTCFAYVQGIVGDQSSVQLALLNHSGGAQVDFTTMTVAIGNTSVQILTATEVTTVWHLTGLTPGASMQLDLAAYANQTSAAFIIVYGATGLLNLAMTNSGSPLVIQAKAA